MEATRLRQPDFAKATPRSPLRYEVGKGKNKELWQNRTTKWHGF